MKEVLQKISYYALTLGLPLTIILLNCFLLKEIIYG